MLSALVTKYRREVGLEPTVKRLEISSRFLQRHNLRPKDVRFEQHIDPIWNQRKVRKPNERRAIVIGSSSYKSQERGQVNERWWIVPKPGMIEDRAGAK